jgi:nitrate reductase alpha subunit
MRDFGEFFAIYKAPVNILSTDKIKPDEGSITLKFCTAHQKFGIHTTFIDLQIMQNLSRGGPHVWLSEGDARSIGVEDNDWVTLYNRNGTVIARAVLSQRIPKGMVIMYHAQDKIINNPFSERTSARGGVHNSLIKILLNPLHMIGGYAQLSYFFNYYGTIGSNRDDFVIVRKLDKVTWTQNERGSEAL